MSEAGDSDHVRVGNTEREQASTLLGTHFSAGRLTVEEYQHRVGAATTAVTLGELKALFADLPAPHPNAIMPYRPPPMPPAVLRDAYPVEVSPKSKVVAGVLQIVPGFGIGRFYTGHTAMAVAQLLVGLFTLGFGWFWSLIDGIILLSNGGTDAEGRQLRD